MEGVTHTFLGIGGRVHQIGLLIYSLSLILLSSSNVGRVLQLMHSLSLSPPFLNKAGMYLETS